MLIHGFNMNYYNEYDQKAAAWVAEFDEAWKGVK